MYRRLWTMKHVDDLCKEYINKESDSEANILEAVLPTIKEYIGILEENYSPSLERDPDEDLGGVLYLFLEPINEEHAEYKNLLNKYHITSIEYAENDDVISEDDRFTYKSQVFILSSDFGIIIIFPMIRENGRRQDGEVL